MTLRPVPEPVQFILNEDVPTKENDIQDGYNFEYTYMFGGSRFPEEQFKQRLIREIKASKKISTMSAIPEAVEIIVHGLKEGAEVKGIALFEFNNFQIIVRAKKVKSGVKPD
jgi:hypothetical protein